LLRRLRSWSPRAVSRTRQLVASLRTALGAADPLPPRIPVPAIPAPPVRVYAPRP